MSISTFNLIGKQKEIRVSGSNQILICKEKCLSFNPINGEYLTYLKLKATKINQKGKVY